MIFIRKFNITIIQHNLKLPSHQIIKLHRNLAVKWLIECRCSSSSSNKKDIEMTSKVISRAPSKIVFKPIDDKTIMRKLIEEKEKESGSSIDKFKQKSKQNVSHWIDVVTGRSVY